MSYYSPIQAPASKSIKFAHRAMATVFEILVVLKDEKYARQAAQDAFFRLDHIEQELSRFIPNSDIAKINHAENQDIIRVGIHAFNCLKISAELYKGTNGAFDISVGLLFDCWLNRDRTLRHPSEQQLTWALDHTGLHHLAIDESLMMVQVLQAPLCLDLGGIGKGYAVDQMAQVLREWGIDDFLIHGGASSVIVSGRYESDSGWSLSLSRPWQQQQAFERIVLADHAISGSGVLKGQHIINPRSAQPVSGNMAAWAFAPTAAYSDALATAFMVMSTDEIAAFCQNNRDVAAIFLILDQGKERASHFGHRNFFSGENDESGAVL